jgi:hypothetical protein
MIGLVLMLSSCSAKATPTDWSRDTNECQITSSATINGTSAGFVGCRVHYYADGEVVTVQLVTAGTSGSFLEPAPGWLVINTNANSPENATLTAGTVSGGVLPLSVPLNSASLIYVMSSGALASGSGPLQVGSNVVYPSTREMDLNATFDGIILAASSGNLSMAGAVTVHAGAATGGGGGGGGGAGGGPCNQSACARYTNACSAGGMAPCYCAAACECACANDPCEAENRTNAAQLGTTCSY